MFGALEYDLRAFCHGVDIRDLYLKKITYRQIATWIRHLPEESALSRRRMAGEELPSDRERLMVASVNEQRLANHYFIMANSDEKAAKNLPEPNLIELPD